MTPSSLEADADRQGPHQGDHQRRRLWPMFLAGPVIYLIYFIVVWTLGEFGCLAGIQQLRPFGVNLIFVGIVALTAAAGLIIFAFGMASFRRWRKLRHGPAEAQEEGPAFMLYVGIWLDGIFLAVTLLTAAPLLVGSACAWL